MAGIAVCVGGAIDAPGYYLIAIRALSASKGKACVEAGYTYGCGYAADAVADVSFTLVTHCSYYYVTSSTREAVSCSTT
jgi:hypothetical protein